MQDKYRTRDARVQNKNACQAHNYRTTADAPVRWSPFQVVCMHKTFRRMESTSPDKEWMRRRDENEQDTHMNEDERI